MKLPHFSIKIMKTEPDVTEEEIRRAMDFGNVLKMIDQRNLNRRKSYRFITISSLILTIVAVIGFLLYLPSQRVSKEKKEIAIHSNDLTTSDTTSQIKNQQVKEPIAKEIKQATQKTVTSKKIHESPHSEKQIVTTSAFVAAEPLDGFPALYNFINRALKYPAEAVKDSIQGVVTINFIVNEHGQPGEFVVINTLSVACDKEALRVVQKMPLWKPATLDGKPISSKLTIPLNFSLQTNRK